MEVNPDRPLMLLSQIDPMVGLISILAIGIILIGLVLKRIKQPYIVGYILIGVLLGESGLGLVTDAEAIHHYGELGIILLLFFIGMEISLPELVRQWRVALIGTFLQVGASVLIVLGIGYALDWQITRSVVLGFAIALSSSAVIIRVIKEKNLIESPVGKSVLSVLLTQDIIIVPLLIITSFLGGEGAPLQKILLMLIGGLAIIGILIWVYTRHRVRLPFSTLIERDHELQVFLALLFCFGGALLTSLFGLSAALGAFVGGMILHAADSTSWIHDTLHSFRVVFVAIFFVSVGLQIDLAFIWQNALPIVAVVLAVYLTNHLLNTFILRFFGCGWRDAFLGGALLAQIGELSFLLSSSAFNLAIIGTYEYQFTISLISLTLMISPFWISLAEWGMHNRAGPSVLATGREERRP
jgi:CPA2 family monovalent cation:H+ antiporter-2